MLLINPKVGDKVICSNTDAKLDEYRVLLSETAEKEATAKKADDEAASSSSSPCIWTFYEDKKNDENYAQGYRVKLSHQKPIKNMAWHPKGDYFSTVLDAKNSNSSVIMHQLSRQKSVRPFSKMTGSVQQVTFHPTKPILFVAVIFSTIF